MLTKFLQRRQITGEEPIFGLIVDLHEDRDIWDFRYHYFVPIYSCHKCKKPI